MLDQRLNRTDDEEGNRQRRDLVRNVDRVHAYSARRLAAQAQAGLYSSAVNGFPV